MNELLESLKSLTTEQFDKCQERTSERVKKRIGEYPTRKQFQRDLGTSATILDGIALIVFCAALVVSSIHIIAHMGRLADISYGSIAQLNSGLVISRDFYVSAHQWMLIPLAEGSMILFLVMFGMTEKNWRKWVYLLLALVAVAFVLVANVQSGIGVLESILAPVFTIGIGLKLEQLIVQSLKRRDEVNRRYVEALVIWEASTYDPTLHLDYWAILRQEIWQKLVSLKANQQCTDAAPAFKLAAVEREIQRKMWAYGDSKNTTLPAHRGEKDEVPVNRPFGHTLPEPEDHDSTAITPSANGHTGDVNGQIVTK